MRPLTSVALLLAGDRAKLLAGDGHEGLLHVVALTHAGPTLGVIIHHTDVEREYV